jgi:hypothetical protein
MVHAVPRVGVFQLSVLGVLQSRALGAVDGPFSAPIDARLWSGLQFHATAAALLRALSTLVIIVVTYTSAALRCGRVRVLSRHRGALPRDAAR